MKAIQWDARPELSGDPKHGQLLVNDGPASDEQLDACIDQQVHASCQEQAVLLTLKGRTGDIFQAQIVGPADASSRLPDGMTPGDVVSLPLGSIHNWN